MSGGGFGVGFGAGSGGGLGVGFEIGLGVGSGFGLPVGEAVGFGVSDDAPAAGTVCEVAAVKSIVEAESTGIPTNVKLVCDVTTPEKNTLYSSMLGALLSVKFALHVHVLSSSNCRRR